MHGTRSDRGPCAVCGRLWPGFGNIEGLGESNQVLSRRRGISDQSDREPIDKDHDLAHGPLLKVRRLYICRISVQFRGATSPSALPSFGRPNGFRSCPEPRPLLEVDRDIPIDQMQIAATDVRVIPILATQVVTAYTTDLVCLLDTRGISAQATANRQVRRGPILSIRDRQRSACLGVGGSVCVGPTRLAAAPSCNHQCQECRCCRCRTAVHAHNHMRRLRVATPFTIAGSAGVASEQYSSEGHARE